MTKNGKLKITQIRGYAGRTDRQIATVKALGLKRRHHSVEQDDVPEIRGMIAKVKFMINVEQVV